MRPRWWVALALGLVALVALIIGFALLQPPGFLITNGARNVQVVQRGFGVVRMRYQPVDMSAWDIQLFSRLTSAGWQLHDLQLMDSCATSEIHWLDSDTWLGPLRIYRTVDFVQRDARTIEIQMTRTLRLGSYTFGAGGRRLQADIICSG